MKRNAQDVWKSSPEEQQTLAEIEALVSELKAMGMATQGLGLGQVAGGPAAGLPGSVQAGQGAPAPGLGQGQPGQAPGYGGTDDDYSEDGELDGSGDDQEDPDQYDQTEPDGDEGEDPDQAGDDDINARNQEKKPMKTNNLARKAAQMAGVTGDKTITPKSPATAPDGKGDDNWGEGEFDAEDDESEPEAGRKGAGIQDNGLSVARDPAFAYKAKLLRELARVDKAIEATEHDGSDNLDSASTILGDLPQYDIDDIEDLSRETGASAKAVEKMLSAINKRHSQKVAKSQANAEMNNLRRTVQKQSQILDEVLSGIRAAAGVEGFPAAEPQRTVNKSARPVSTYPHDQARGGDILSQIADLVVQKSGGMRQVGQSYGDPELDALLGSDGGNPNESRGQDVHKSMSAFANLFGQTAGSQWGGR